MIGAAETARRPGGPSTELPRGGRLAALALTALGVVYGDIGTSPLYAFRECFRPTYGLDATPEAVSGVLSLIAWSLILIVSVKYLLVIIRLDNNGEGGTMALLAMLPWMRRRGLFVGQASNRADCLGGDSDGHFTRHLTGCVAAHTVGHDEDAVVGEHEVVVFIARTDDADVGASGAGEVHETPLVGRQQVGKDSY